MSEDNAETDVDVAREGAAPERIAQRFWRPIGTQRALQIVLGLFWILDAALQFQPFMFKRDFVETFILPNASGQPAVVSWIITNIGHFLEPHIALWNTFFALIQLVIGTGLLFPRTVRPALGLSFAWALGVWVLGEGLGMILTGGATALSGAPGSVLIYGLIGLMAWPTRRSDDSAVGVDSSASAHGLGGRVTPLVVWSGYWSLAAVLFLLPQNRTRGSISGMITDMASGNPSWFDHFLNSLGSGLSSVGNAGGWILAIASLIIGFGPLVSRRPGIFLAAGGVLAFAMWVVAQGWIGGIFSGSSTDPNSGPLIIVLALAMTPASVAAPYVGRTPLSEAWRRHGPWIGIGLSGVLLALFLSALYPVAPAQSSDSAMSGMSGMAGMNGMSGSTTTDASSASCTGTNHSGLDVTNSPLMTMAGPGTTMNMNGADASAAAGLNSVKENWHYTGPALPSAESQLLLADGGNTADQVHMARSGCAKEPTFSDQITAAQYIQATTKAVASLSTTSGAVAAGYVPVSPTDYPVVYYVNPTIAASNAAVNRTLDPTSIDGLVYATTPSGDQVLAAAMYVYSSSVATPPMPYGSLVQWHQRTQVCGPGATAVKGSSTLAITGYPPCPAGSVVQPTPYVTMVWQVPVAGGPLAIQPPDIQIVEAATMQTSA